MAHHRRPRSDHEELLMPVRRPGRLLPALSIALVGLTACAAPDEEPAEFETLEEGGADPTIDEDEAEALPDNGAHGEIETEQDATDDGVPLLDTATSEEYGEYLTDGDGRALYVSATDPPGESGCTDACLEEWPILSVDDSRELAEGVDEALVGSLQRDDLPDESFEQVTYRDKPLHYHVQDELPGQVTAQGTDDRWFLIGPDGVELRD
jgi:predicted lipoprotein with Yx(FWY)xxD motif